MFTSAFFGAFYYFYFTMGKVKVVCAANKA